MQCLALATVFAWILAIRPELAIGYSAQDWFPAFTMHYGIPVLVAVLISLLASPAVAFYRRFSGDTRWSTRNARPFSLAHLLLAVTLAAVLFLGIRTFGSEQTIRIAIALSFCLWVVAATALIVYHAERLHVWMFAFIPIQLCVFAWFVAAMARVNPDFLAMGVLEFSYVSMVALITLLLRWLRRSRCQGDG